MGGRGGGRGWGGGGWGEADRGEREGRRRMVACIN